jgi:hypothetical protein
MDKLLAEVVAVLMHVAMDPTPFATREALVN